jgi:hypothetical protein
MAGRRTYDRDRGLLKLKGNDDLLEEARRDGEDSISTFVSSLGYREVMFE